MQTEISRSMLRNGLILGLFALCTVGVVTLTRLGTADRIAAAERAAQVKALGEILPAGSYDNDLLADSLQLTDSLLGSDKPLSAWRARKDGQVNAIIFESNAPDGYSGSIRLLVGVQADGHLAGVRALSHRETPGLGDNIDLAKSSWILAFNGKSLLNPSQEGWAVKKDKGEFDQFAGATITPRAVVKAVHQTLQYFDAHRAELLGTSEEQAR